MKRFLKVIGYIALIFVVLFAKHMVKQIFFKQEVAIECLEDNYYDKDKIDLAVDILDKEDNDYDDEAYISALFNVINENEPEELRFYNKLYTKEEYDLLMSKNNKKLEASTLTVTDDYTYLKIGSFRKVDYMTLVEDHLDEINKSEMLIIDLRNNSGGLIDNYSNFAELFLNENDLLFKLKENEKTDDYTANEKAVIEVKDVILIVNNKTASVSELLVLTFESSFDHCYTVGETTYGKYFAYGVKEFIDESKMMFITSIMLGPEEQPIPSTGLVPEIEYLDDQNLDLSDYLNEVLEEVNLYKNSNDLQ